MRGTCIAIAVIFENPDEGACGLRQCFLGTENPDSVKGAVRDALILTVTDVVKQGRIFVDIVVTVLTLSSGDSAIVDEAEIRGYLAEEFGGIMEAVNDETI